MAEPMESASCSETKRSYSWWWDSHITPKNSKWLQENLTDMDNKIKSMIKLMEEDADSFARRAEMYYKKRPEFMKLVEEFYRAYRALAERYDHVTGALRQAHQTIAVAFPSQIQLILPDEPPSGLPDSVEEARHLNDEMSIKVTNHNIAQERCLDLEKENRSLQFELSKFNEAMSRQMEDVSNLFNENQNLHNTVKLESIRGEQAEAESCRLTDDISKLKSEMETALLQYKVSQERISDLEAEISRSGQQIQNFNVEMSIRSSKLNMAEEQYIILQEENKSLQSTIDNYKMIVERQAEEVTLREEELSKLKQFIEDEHQLYKYAGIQEYMSLQMEFNTLKQRVTGKEEELAVRDKELDKLEQSLEDERKRRMIAEVANQSLKILYSQSAEKVRLLGLEIRSGTELLRRIELSKTGLEEKIKRFHDEKKDLNEKNFYSVSKISGLQDEINFLKRSKFQISDELSFHLDENEVLQQDLSSVKNERNNLEERHHELMEQMEEINFNMVSVRALIQELLDGKKELKDEYKKHEGEKVFNLEDLRIMESISEKNSLLVNSLYDVNAELDWLREKIKGLEECRESLHGNAGIHSEKTVLVSHVETVTQNIKKLSEKSALFENSFSDIFADFEGLRGKVKSLEESCQSLSYQNCYLIAENSNLVTQVEKIEQQMESFDNRFSTFEGKLVNMEKEKDLALYQVKELKDMLRSEKEEHENHDFFFKNQTSALNNQIHLLKEKDQLINEELVEEQHKTVKSDIDCFILQRVLYDINEKNLILSDECQKYMEKLRRAEKLTLELKQDQSTQEKKIELLFDHNKKLSEWVHVMVRAFDAEEESGISKVGNKNIVQLIWHNMIDLQASVSDSNEEFYHHIHLEKSPFAILLEQLGLSLVELRAQKNVLEQEYEKKIQEISVLHSKNNELMDVNKQLMKDLNASDQQKEELVDEGLSDLQEAQCTSEGEIPKLLAETEYLSSKFYELREHTNALEEKTEAVLEEAMIHEQLSCILRNSDAEKISGIDKLISDVHLQTENVHLRDLVNFETRNSVLLDDDDDRVSNVLEQKDMEWSDTHPSFQNMQLKNKELCTNLESLMVEFNKANVVGEELEKKILFLLEENVRKDDEIEFRHQSNGNFVGEISRLHKEAEALRKREMNLASELQKAKDESRCFEEESAAYFLHIYGASINELVFRQKVVELMLKVKSLEASDSVQSEMPTGEISLGNVQREDLMENLDALERENKGLNAELTAYLPPVVSLDNDIASLEEHSLSLANHHILRSHRKQGNNLLAPLQPKRFNQVRSKDHTPKVSAGIMELKKLLAKVKQLQKTVITDTERLLAEEEIFDTNLACETRKIKLRISKGSAHQLETQKKKNIVLDSRKCNAADKDVRLLKIDQEVSKEEHEQRMKDIELDHVSSRFRSGDDFNAEVNEQAREMLEPVTDNVIEEERSEEPFLELVQEKELSVDKLELPESHQEWSRRVSETLSSDALRLSILQKKVEELKKSINVSEMSSQSSSSALNTITEQLKVLEGVFMELIDINFKLAKMAANFSASLDDNEGRRKISEGAQSASKKIGGVELEFQNTQSLLSKLLEEQESKAVKALHWKSRIPLKYIYWKRNDSRKKKRRFCACMRLNAMSA